MLETLDYFYLKCRIAVMVEHDRHSPEFQTAFRESLAKHVPEILLTIEILESNGLAVTGYARSTDNDIVLEVGFPSKDGERLKEVFELRVNPYVKPLNWDFQTVAYMDELSPKLQEKLLHQEMREVVLNPIEQYADELFQELVTGKLTDEQLSVKINEFEEYLENKAKAEQQTFRIRMLRNFSTQKDN